MSDVITDDDIHRLITQQTDLNFSPGDEFLYSNTGYTLLGMTVERVSGMPLEQFAKQRIFAPLGMNHTHFQRQYGTVVKNRAYSYLPDGASGYKYVALSYSTVGPSSLFSTTEDLARWDDNFYTAQVGGGEVLSELQAIGKLNNGKEINYASGLFVDKYRGLKRVWHSGGDAGYRTNILRFPDFHFSVVVLGNAADLNPVALSLKIADIYLEGNFANSENTSEARSPIVKDQVKLEPEALDAFVGDFEMRPGFVITFSKEDGELVEQATGQAKFPIYPSSANTFFAKAFAAEFVFDQAGPDGKVHSATLHQHGRDFPLKRLDPLSLTKDQLRNHAGKYYSEELGVIYTLLDQGGNLIVRYPRGDIPLKQIGNDSFVGQFPIGGLRFLCSENDPCKGFELDDGRVRKLRFSKVDIPSPGTVP